MIGLIARPYPMTYVATTTFDVPFSAQFPGSNMTNNDYGRVALVSPVNGTGFLVRFDMGAPVLVDTLALLWHDLPADATIAVGYSNSNTAGTADFTTVVSARSATTGSTRRDILNLKKFLATLPNRVLGRYWQFSIGLPTMPAKFQISRAFIGRGAQFAIGPQKASLGAKDLNASVTTEVGEQRNQEDLGLIRPVVSLSFEYGKQSEMEQVLGEYTLSLGVSKPMLICTDLTSASIQDNTAFGRPEKVVQLDSSLYDVWSFEAVVPSLGV